MTNNKRQPIPASWRDKVGTLKKKIWRIKKIRVKIDAFAIREKPSTNFRDRCPWYRPTEAEMLTHAMLKTIKNLKKFKFKINLPYQK